MADLADLNNDLILALDTAGYSVASQWSVEPQLTGIPKAQIKIAGTSEADAGSNLRVRIAEVVLEIARNRFESGGAPLENIEGDVTGYMEDLTAISWWTALSSVRASPLPEIEVETEPTSVGTVIYFKVRAECVLEA